MINKDFLKDIDIDNNASDEFLVRVSKIKTLIEKGINPWPNAIETNSNSKNIISEFNKEISSNKIYSLAGRILAIRLHGKTTFVNLQDFEGKLQLYIKQDIIGEEKFEIFKNLIDIADIIFVEGKPFKTKTGEITLEVSNFVLLSKSLYPLPDKFHGLVDIEAKYRQRYLDLIINQDTKNRFIKRSKIISLIRSFLDRHGYLEVETPMLHLIAGGAAAKPFITYYNALKSNFYLRIAPELYLKKLVIGGIEKVYEINRNFRNEGISTKHNPEFTMIEFYTAYKDYHFSMDFVEELIKNLVKELYGDNLILDYGNIKIDFSKPFKRLSLKEAVIIHANLTEDDLSINNIDNTLDKFGLECKGSIGEKIYKLFEELAESKLIDPTYIIDFPLETSPLAKADSMNPSIAARYELFIAGMEISNSYNELNDPFEQARRFKEQIKAYNEGNDEVHQYDADFIKALEHGLPPTVGVGIGIDRLTMLLTNTTSIKEVILFPTLKKE